MKKKVVHLRPTDKRLITSEEREILLDCCAKIQKLTKDFSAMISSLKVAGSRNYIDFSKISDTTSDAKSINIQIIRILLDLENFSNKLKSSE